jgi:hypothetical protein
MAETPPCTMVQCSLPPVRSQWPPRPPVSEAPGCLVLGCAETAERLWAHDETDRVVRWPVCRTHYLRLHAGEHWHREPAPAPEFPGWLLMRGDHEIA